MATGQARVVRWPGGEVVDERTERRVVAAADLALPEPGVRRTLGLPAGSLELALPFPRLHTVTQLHDHWLAMCAAATGGYAVLDEVVQDYVQHGANVVGEHAAEQRGTPSGALRVWTGLADRYEGGHRPLDLLRVSQDPDLRLAPPHADDSAHSSRGSRGPPDGRGRARKATATACPTRPGACRLLP